MIRRLTAVLLLCLAPALAAGAPGIEGPEDRRQVVDRAGAFEFLVLGDWGAGGRGCQSAVASRMAAYAGGQGLDFVISTGDNFYERGVRSVEDEAWERSFEAVYRDPALQVPWYAVLGNHDYQGSTAAQMAYTGPGGRWHMPARHYSFETSTVDGPLALFVFLDTSPFVGAYRWRKGKYPDLSGQDSRSQLRWLDRTLSESRAPWKIVVGHHPVFSGGALHGPTGELLDLLRPLLERHSVQVYFSGHDHNLQHLKPPGPTHYVVSGGGSEARRVLSGGSTLFARRACGFVAAELTAGELRLLFIDDGGEVLHRAVIRRDENP